MNRAKGFTLVELMVVIGLIMILSVVGIGSYTTATIKAKDTQRKNDLNQMAKAVEAFNNDVGRYPLSAVGEINPQCYTKNGATVENYKCTELYSLIEGGSAIYIKIPSDPDPAQNYAYISDGSKFAFYAALENLSDRDLLKDADGKMVTYDKEADCGSNKCNYKITETGLIKSL